MNLSRLSDNALLERIKNLVAKEREVLVEVLHHLQEVDARKLFLDIGYPSLWAYCIQELQYSEASAQRRIEAMRALRDLPALEKKMSSGTLSLTNVAKAQAAIRKHRTNTLAEQSLGVAGVEEKLDIFLQIENKSQREADAILAGYFPEQVKMKEIVRNLNSEICELRLSLPLEVLAKLEKVKSLFSHAEPNPPLAKTIELMADFVIRKKDLSQASENSINSTRTSNRANLVLNRTVPILSRHIPMSPRRMIWRAAGGTCEYVSVVNGRRCGGRHQLEIEHVRPRSFGGTNDPKNLKLFCRAHNVQAAREATLMS